MRTLIGNVLAFDGSGQPGVVCDLVINDEMIESIQPTGASSTSAQTADTVIDGTGLAAAPGFIDVHTHDDFAVIAHPDMAFKNRGGVTTCVVGNCGFGAAPHQSPPPFAASMHPGHDLPLFDGYGQYMAYLEKNQPGVNVGVLAGHGSIRAAALGRVAHNPDHEPTPAELAAMCEIMTEALDAGVFGYSSGLVYEPGRHATTAELIAMAKTMTGTGALYATHMRDEGERLVEAVAEAIRIGREADVAVQISHHKAAGMTNWGQGGRIVSSDRGGPSRGATGQRRPVSLHGRKHDARFCGRQLHDRRRWLAATGQSRDRQLRTPAVMGGSVSGGPG